MNVTLNKTDAVNAVLTMEVKKADYQERVDKALRNFKAKANIPGFRQGMVPMGMVKKMHGKAILIEELNRFVSDELYKYIKENNLNILGEPIPQDSQNAIDFDTQEDFEFSYDLGFSPELAISLNKRNKVPYYTVVIDDEMVDKQITSYRASYGTYNEADTVEAKDMIKGTMTELEKSKPKEGGLVVEDAVLMPSYIKNEKEQAKFIGAAKDGVVKFSPKKAYGDADAEIASLLKITKEEVANHTGDFKFEIKNITRYGEAEINQELFDRVFGVGEVKDEKAFKEKVKELLAQQFVADSEYKFMLDVRGLIDKKAGKLEYPETFLKKWLLLTQENKTAEDVDAEYPEMIKSLQVHLIKEQLVKISEVKIEEEDLRAQARKAVKAQFAQYGMMTIPDDMLDNYAAEMLKKQDTIRNLVDGALEEKVAAWLKEQVALDKKEVSYEEFQKLFA